MIQSVAISWHVTCLAMSCHALFPIQLSLFTVHNSALLHAIRLVSEVDCFFLSYLILSHRIVSHRHIHITYSSLPGVERKIVREIFVRYSNRLMCGVV